jgi:hypothetical protein
MAAYAVHWRQENGGQREAAKRAAHTLLATLAPISVLSMYACHADMRLRDRVYECGCWGCNFFSVYARWISPPHGSYRVCVLHSTTLHGRLHCAPFLLLLLCRRRRRRRRRRLGIHETDTQYNATPISPPPTPLGHAAGNKQTTLALRFPWSR